MRGFENVLYTQLGLQQTIIFIIDTFIDYLLN